MTRQFWRGIVTVAFVGMLIGPLFVRRASLRSESANQASSRAELDLLHRYGFVLQESSAAAGIEFVHQPPRIDPRLDHIGPQVAAMGASVAVVDFDGDGWLDLYVTNSSLGSRNRLYRNRQDGTFADVATVVGLADENVAGTGACMGSVWADMDNDGDDDVLIYKWGQSELFRNQSGARFERLTNSLPLPAWANIGAATWLDYDLDGHLDLFLAGYWPDDVRLEHLVHTRVMPESFEYANNGGRKWLLHNSGDGQFTDVTDQVGIASRRWTLAVVAADFNQDGFPDLFLSNDYGVSELYLNNQGHNFREVGKESGIGYAPKSGMNASVGDVLNQGRLAIYETNISEQGVLIQGNNLWVPKGSKSVQFHNLASVMGVELGGWSFGAQFGDLNNDGFLDLYLTNGYFSGDPATSYWYDFSQIAGGHSRIISDAANWPAMRGRSLAGYQNKHVWINDGAGQFQDVAAFVGVDDRYDGRAVALADLSNRGVLDVVVANQRGPVLLYRNQVAVDRHWIEFELKGHSGNRGAVGAQVELHWGGQRQLQEVVAASGYAAQNQRRLHFGLGRTAVVDRVIIRWPAGPTQTWERPEVDQLHYVLEPQ
jgi:hypothetical protein